MLSKKPDYLKRMKPLTPYKTRAETATHFGNKMLFSPANAIVCCIMMACLLVGAWLFSGGIDSFVFLLLFVGLLYAIVFVS